MSNDKIYTGIEEVIKTVEVPVSPKWVKYLIPGLIILAMLCGFLYFKKDNTPIAVSTSTTTTVFIPTSPNIFEPLSPTIEHFLVMARMSLLIYLDGPKRGQLVINDYSDSQLVVMAIDACRLFERGLIHSQIVKILLGFDFEPMHAQLMSWLVNTIEQIVCSEISLP